MHDVTRGPRAVTARLDRAIARVACREHRLMGIALLRIAIGVGTVGILLTHVELGEDMWQLIDQFQSLHQPT